MPIPLTATDAHALSVAIAIYLGTRPDQAQAPPPAAIGRCAYCGGTDATCVACGSPLGEGVRV